MVPAQKNAPIWEKRVNKKDRILAEAGIDMEEIMENTGYDENVMDFVLKAFLQDANFDKFNESIEKKEYEEAFLAAHTLKGVFSNLAMKNLQNVCSVIVEKLRNKDYDNISEDIKDFRYMYNKMNCAIVEVYE